MNDFLFLFVRSYKILNTHCFNNYATLFESMLETNEQLHYSCSEDTEEMRNDTNSPGF